MYLKTIEVQGFKSFAQKILFEFHNGITGIVGPNGSGKSNVADAVRWVLGEQRVRQLRGGNMQDVIFSGTENRKPLSFAYVAITLDNGDHQLPIDFEEVTVARRLYRSGESEYLINGRSCRLKDVQELFYDTGIGKEGYSIIGQGQIDQILSGKPEDRRELFDEAAGIVKFKRRKMTTLKKLEEEQQNLVRVTDILSELTRQLEPLKAQSETARIYLQKREELRLLDVNLFLLQMEEARESLKMLEETFFLTNSQLLETKQAFEQTGQEYQRLEKELEELDGRMEASRKASQERALLRQQLEGRLNVLKEQMHSHRQKKDHDEQRLTILGRDEEEKSGQLREYESQRVEAKEKLEAITEAKKETKGRLALLHSQMEDLSSAVENGKNELIEILNERAGIKGKSQRFDTMMEQVEIRKAQLTQRAIRLKGDENEQQQQLAQAQGISKALQQEISSLEEEGRQIRQQEDILQQEIREANAKLEEAKTDFHREASRLESLKNIAERYDGYGNSIRRVMEQKRQHPGILGVVADLIHVEKKYETAIETALGGSIQNIVTDNEQTAKAMIEYLKKNRYGRATFLPLTNLSDRGGFSQKAVLSEKGVIGLAASLVQAEEMFGTLVAHLLGKTVVVSHVDDAIAIARKYRHSIRMVTLEGELFSPGGSMTGGAYKNSSNLLGRRREIEERKRAVEGYEREMQRLQETIDGKRDKRTEIRRQGADLQEKLQEAYLKKNTADLQMRQIEEKKAEVQTGYARLQRDSQELKRQTEELRRSTGHIREKMERSEKEETIITQLTEFWQRELEGYQQEESATAKELEKIRLSHTQISQEESFLAQNMERVSGELSQLQEEKSQIQEELRLGEEEIGRKEETAACVLKEMEEAQTFTEQEEVRLTELQKQKEEKNASYKSFFEKRDELSGQINLLDKECFRLTGQRERLEELQEEQIHYLWEEYEITPREAKAYRKEALAESSSIRRDIGKLKEEMKSLGHVNVNAIEEYKEVSERHSFLSVQYEDLVTAEETLKGIIQELDEGMRRQFGEKFREIQREFDKAFKELFGGGKGSLELLDDDDLLETGIRIIAQPPGKKLQNMMQLSGGEKALTAIALLFAIQNLKPSPFCLLDEIEAALDDSNVVRYARYLKKLTKNTQFIIITHRRGTMNAADRLYGITMQEKGISTLVSVDLVEHDLDQ